MQRNAARQDQPRSHWPLPAEIASASTVVTAAPTHSLTLAAELCPPVLGADVDLRIAPKANLE
eukprot:2965358-Amphidinium_carterae.2